MGTSILPIGATESEVAYVLDGFYGQESRLELDEHYVDTGGANDHVFGMFSLLGKRFAPRLRDLKDWRLHAFEDAGIYPLLKRHIGERIDTSSIREAWDELLRIGLSIEGRVVAPSTVLKKLAALPKNNLLSRALREFGRIERTLFMIEWHSDPALRLRCRAGPQQGRGRHQARPRGVLPRARRNPRRLLREPGLSRLRPQPGGQRHHPMEHGLPLPCRRSLAFRRARSTGRAAATSRRKSGNT